MSASAPENPTVVSVQLEVAEASESKKKTEADLSAEEPEAEEALACIERNKLE